MRYGQIYLNALYIIAFITLIGFFFALLSGCSKPDQAKPLLNTRFCYTCTISIHAGIDSMGKEWETDTSKDTLLCGVDNNFIREFEKENSNKQVYQTANSYRVTTTEVFCRQ